jgi:RNase P subunit RPR2
MFMLVPQARASDFVKITNWLAEDKTLLRSAALNLFKRKTDISLPAALPNAVTCKNCQTEIPIMGEVSHLPEAFSVPCPLCGARKMFERSEVHVAKPT